MNTPSTSPASSLAAKLTALALALAPASACDSDKSVTECDASVAADGTIADSTAEIASAIDGLLSQDGTSMDTQIETDGLTLPDTTTSSADVSTPIDISTISADMSTLTDETSTSEDTISLPIDATNPVANVCVEAWKQGKGVDPCTIKDKKYAEKVQSNATAMLQTALSKFDAGSQINKQQPNTWMVLNTNPNAPYAMVFQKHDESKNNPAIPWLVVVEGKQSIALYGNAQDAFGIGVLGQTSDDPNCMTWDTYMVKKDGTTEKWEQKQSVGKTNDPACVDSPAVGLCAEITSTVADTCITEDSDTLMTHMETEMIAPDAAKGTIATIMNTLKQLAAKVGLTQDLGL